MGIITVFYFFFVIFYDSTHLRLKNVVMQGRMQRKYPPPTSLLFSPAACASLAKWMVKATAKTKAATKTLANANCSCALNCHIKTLQGRTDCPPVEPFDLCPFPLRWTERGPISKCDPNWHFRNRATIYMYIYIYICIAAIVFAMCVECGYRRTMQNFPQSLALE